MADLESFTREPDASETERDTADNCDAFAILDDMPVRAMDECEVCGHHECRHYCGWHRVMRPCPCDRDAAFFDGPLYRGRAGGRTKR